MGIELQKNADMQEMKVVVGEQAPIFEEQESCTFSLLSTGFVLPQGSPFSSLWLQFPHVFNTAGAFQEGMIDD